MKKIIIIANELKRGGIANYLNRIIPYLEKKNEIYTVSRDNYNSKRHFVIKINKYFNFWPFKEIIFAYKCSRILKNNNYNLIICNYSCLGLIKEKTINIFHSTHKQYVHSKNVNLFTFILKIVHFFLIPLDTYRVNNSFKSYCVSKNLCQEIKNSIYLPNLPSKAIKNYSKFVPINPLFISVFRNDPFKGIDLLIKLVPQIKREFPGSKFIIVGKKIEHKDIVSYDELDHNHVVELLKRADIFISTSVLENSPNTLYETFEAKIVPFFYDVGDTNTICEGHKYTFKNRKDLLFKLNFIIGKNNTISINPEYKLPINHSYPLITELCHNN